MKKKGILFLVFSLFLIYSSFHFIEKNTSYNLLSQNEMRKIKGGGQWVGFRCLNAVRVCSQWSDPCPGLPDGTPCSACSGLKAFVPCVKGTCNDICNFQYMHCDHWFTGICSGKSCQENNKTLTDCYLPDC